MGHANFALYTDIVEIRETQLYAKTKYISGQAASK